MLVVIGTICLIAFWIFMSIVIGRVLSTYYLSGEPEIDGTVVVFGAFFWPVTLIILAGLHVGEYLCRKK